MLVLSFHKLCIYMGFQTVDKKTGELSFSFRFICQINKSQPKRILLFVSERSQICGGYSTVLQNGCIAKAKDGGYRILFAQTWNLIEQRLHLSLIQFHSRLQLREPPRCSKGLYQAVKWRANINQKIWLVTAFPINHLL